MTVLLSFYPADSSIIAQMPDSVSI